MSPVEANKNLIQVHFLVRLICQALPTWAHQLGRYLALSFYLMSRRAGFRTLRHGVAVGVADVTSFHTSCARLRYFPQEDSLGLHDISVIAKQVQKHNSSQRQGASDSLTAQELLTSGP